MYHPSLPTRFLLLMSALLALAAPLTLTLSHAPARADQPTPPPTTAPRWVVWRVYVADLAAVRRLTSGPWDVLEARGPDYLLVLGGDAEAEALRALGYRVTEDHTLPALAGRDLNTFFGGYRTVTEHYAKLDALAVSHPHLVTLVDYGDSWRKLNSLPNGHDLRAICITEKQAGDCALTPTAPKPRFVLMAAIHARELSTSEMAWRLMDELVNNYNVDADITALLRHTEVWIIPVANPDGRYIVQNGESTPYSQRKNANNSLGACSNPPTGSSQHGVDLNRNGTFGWGGLGTSTNPCNLTYLGVSAASEPEQWALENLFRQLFPDQRGPGITDAAPLTSTGVFVSLHTYSNLMLFPWGYVECGGTACAPASRAPNDEGLRALGFRMSYFNGYSAGQPSELLYAASGGTDDQAYGDLGVASYTYEIGPSSGSCGGFTPPYSCQDTVFWPANRPALLYAAKAARQPYTLALGPSVLNPALSALTVTAGAPVTLTALIADNTFGSAGIRPPSARAITAAQAYLDIPPWAGGAPITLTASDGAFTSITETVTGLLPTTGLSQGRHLVYVQGRNTSGHWGPITALWLNITAPDAPIAGLTLDSNTPNYITLPSVFTAGVSAGDNVQYTWHFGVGGPVITTAATITYTYAAPGAYLAQVTASNNSSSASLTTTVIISRAPSVITWAPAPSSTAYVGQAVRFQYAVTSPVTPPSGGLVTVSDGGAHTCTASLAGSCLIPFTTAGIYSLTASYNGGARHDPASTAPHSLSVERAPVTLTLVTPAPARPGQPVTITWTANTPFGAPAGPVTVTASGNAHTLTCTADLSAGECAFTPNVSGVYTLAAAYAGSASHQPALAGPTPWLAWHVAHLPLIRR